MRKRNWMTKLTNLAMTGMAAFALSVTTGVANSSCLWYFGQDEMPKGADRLRKF